ncbi:fibronectin type III domain-containing protein [Dysgonomonas sp. Marseille-P4677]|uniref:fibronectin type III domain-containing protein n=1 Tax=Dysgonomonas sp. Marseille-P4677 TaxID=2364790 RepID=UPI001911BCAF|nr:fibronectin type III domain-containing protein [Dysgonomonas sp. Marseille-P4677]MBK5720048.1 fibronectin type III domain-containing protein [Dysgonomonas sp. Marseille-P4677]
MKKILVLLLAFPLFFASCSDDDNNDDNGTITAMTLTGEAVAHNIIALNWSKVDGTYSYQVFFKAEGETKWQTSNFKMADANDPATIEWEGTYFQPEVKYTIMVKAFRDSGESSVIGESNTIEITTPTHLTLIGGWKLTRYSATVKSNKSAYDARIAEFIIREFTLSGKETVDVELLTYFNADLTFSSYENDELESEGNYSIAGDVLTLTGNFDGDKSSDEVYTYSLQKDNLIISLDKKRELEGDYQRALTEILGSDYEGFVLEAATLNVNFTRVE